MTGGNGCVGARSFGRISAKAIFVLLSVAVVVVFQHVLKFALLLLNLEDSARKLSVSLFSPTSTRI